MNKIFLVLVAIALNFAIVRPVKAETTSPTPDMVDQVKILVQENLATTEAKLKEKVDLQSLVGFVGKVTTISSGNFTLDSHGNLLQVTTNTKTSFLKDGQAIKITSLAIGDKIIVIGVSIKDGIVQAKRVTIIKDEPVLVKTTAVVAQVVSIDLKKKTITLNINGTNQVLTLSKKSTVKLAELKVDQTILAIVKEYSGALSISRAKIL
ncbi:hypothetical protein D4S03_06135 [bacterium]|nr:MAG: hypothetical protein D4S03_06135 [bacterium]